LKEQPGAWGYKWWIDLKNRIKEARFELMKRGKKYIQAKEKVKRGKAYGLEEAVKQLKECAYTKFDETVEMSLRLGVDPKHADQMVRGTALLPNGTGKKISVLVLTKGEKEKEAKEAGADFVGLDEYIGRGRGGSDSGRDGTGGEAGEDSGNQENDAQPKIRHGNLRGNQDGKGT
jgi:hypothetical protein